VDEHLTIYPRSKRSFYTSLKNQGHLLWNRPPDNHCSRCADFHKVQMQLNSLQGALKVTGGPGFQDASKIVADVGGTGQAYKLVRELNDQMPELRKHMMWKEHTRVYLKENREMKMKFDEVILQLDYGGFSDSQNDKVSCWSATAVSPAVENQSKDPEYFDFFFDAKNQSGDKSVQGAKKNGHTGKFFLKELLDDKDGVSLFRSRFPDCKHLLLSGDTGNGYRAYEMLEELSTLISKYRYTVELLPLAPAHAFNRTDSHIAHMNKLIKKIKRKGRVFGAEGFAKIFRNAADPTVVGKVNLLKRNNAFFRVVPQPTEEDKDKRKDLGAMLHDDRLANGKVGVRGLLYFDFSMPSEQCDGTRTHPQGYALVRVHPDPTLPNNPTMVWTWRKDLQKLMCQHCSNAAGRVVLLSVAGCTIKTCAVKERNAQAAEQACARSQLPAGNQAKERELVVPGNRKSAGLKCTHCKNLRTAHSCTAVSCKVCTTCTQREGKTVLKSVNGCRKNACKWEAIYSEEESEEEKEEEANEAKEMEVDNGREGEEDDQYGEDNEEEEEDPDKDDREEVVEKTDRNWANQDDNDGYVQVNMWDVQRRGEKKKRGRPKGKTVDNQEKKEIKKKKKEKKKKTGKKDKDDDDDWEVRENMSVFVWDISSEGTKKVYKVNIIKTAEDNIHDKDETCWDVQFNDGEKYYYPESRVFRTKKDAETDMKAS
jgi:hypothetical protein